MPVVQKCDILKQYCEFMEIVFRYQAELKETPTTDEQKTCYEKAKQNTQWRKQFMDFEHYMSLSFRQGTEEISELFSISVEDFTVNTEK